MRRGRHGSPIALPLTPPVTQSPVDVQVIPGYTAVHTVMTQKPAVSPSDLSFSDSEDLLPMPIGDGAFSPMSFTSPTQTLSQAELSPRSLLFPSKSNPSFQTEVAAPVFTPDLSPMFTSTFSSGLSPMLTPPSQLTTPTMSPGILGNPPNSGSSPQSPWLKRRNVLSSPVSPLSPGGFGTPKMSNYYPFDTLQEKTQAQTIINKEISQFMNSGGSALNLVNYYATLAGRAMSGDPMAAKSIAALEDVLKNFKVTPNI